MSALAFEHHAPRRPGSRNTAPKTSENQKFRRKAAASSKGAGLSGSARPAAHPRANVGAGANGAAQIKPNAGPRAKPRPGHQRQNDRTLKKSTPQRLQNAAKTTLNKTSVDTPGSDTLLQPTVDTIGDLVPENTQTRHIPKKGPVPMIKYPPKAIAAAGPLFSDPAQYGFMKPQQPLKPRPVPRYMLVQPRLLAAPPFKQHPWEKANQEKMLQMEAANSGADYLGLYEEFQKMRETERAQMEALGLVDAENITKDLTDAIFFQGTCLDMCPTFERVRRSLENNVKALEKDPATQRISRLRAVKAFSRPAAGQPPPMPSDVRPPKVLQKTLDYIVDNVLPEMPETHSFIWDRTRSIRQDFVYQNYYGPEAIDCNERIVRIHLLSLHVMAGSGLKYSQQQELEQLNKALQTLTEIYLDVRNHGGQCPNEPEFRAYHLLSHFRDPELEREVQTLPDYIFHSTPVQLALKFRMLMSQSNVVERGYTNTIGAVNLFVEFFRLTFDTSTPPLLACLVETHFNEIRFYALKSMSRAYHTKAKAFLAEALRQMLGFNLLGELEDFVSYYDIDTFEENGELHVDLCNKQKLELQYKLNSLSDKPRRLPAYSPQIDLQLRQQSSKVLVNSGHSNVDLQMNRAKIDEMLQNIALQQSTEQKTTQDGVKNSKSTNTAPAKTSNTQALSVTNKQSDLSSNISTNRATPAGSFSLSDYMNNQAVTRSSQIGFGQTAVAPDANTSDFAPNTFTQKKSVLVGFGQLNNTKSFDPKGEEKHVQFAQKIELHPAANSSSLFGIPGKSGHDANFDNQQSPSNENQVAGIMFDEKKKEKTEVKNDFPESKKVFNFGGAGIENYTPKINSESQPRPEIPALTKSIYLKDNEYFSRAINLAYNDILRDTIETQLRKITTQAVQNQSRMHERQRIISIFAEELFSAFLAEQTYQAILKGVAEAHYAKNLKKRAIIRLKTTGGQLYNKQEERRERRNEIESFSFKTPTLKRKINDSCDETTISKRKTPFKISRVNTSFEDMNERQEQLQNLWKPFDLRQFVDLCSKDVKIKSETASVSLNCVIIVENWNAPYSKWLNTKFSLKVSEDKTHYINEVEVSGLKVAFRSLPKTNFVNEKSFRNTPFLMFECGLLENEQVAKHQTLSNKLKRDGAILSKIIQLCDRYSLYKVHVLIIMWDITSSGMLRERQRDFLEIEQLLRADNSVQDIHICDMSAQSANITNDLQTSLRKMGEEFVGQLSKRGFQKRAMMKSKLEVSTPIAHELSLEAQEANNAAASLKAKEAEILKRARDMQKRKYLSAHATANQSGDLTNLSGVFRTPNGTIANHTLMNLNNTILGNNTFLHGRDASFFKSFANGSVIEESTPMGSPGPKTRASPTLTALPKKVQELREITASIRARYKS